MRLPRLGGNRRVGYSPPVRLIGLTAWGPCVRLLGVERDTPDAPALLVGGPIC